MPSRRLDFHPHVHLGVPAAVDAAKQRWRRQRRGKNGTYLFNEKAMAKVFWAKMLAAIEAAGIGLPACHPREWVAHCKSVGSGEQALIYLARYLHRAVIRGQDILACENGRMSFRHRNAEPFRSRPSGVHASVANREKMFAEGTPSASARARPTNGSIAASHDLSLFARPHYTSHHTSQSVGGWYAILACTGRKSAVQPVSGNVLDRRPTDGDQTWC